jgi:hypothetical protein
MKGDGYYASNSSLQFQAIESIAPLITAAMEKVKLPPATSSFNIVDYGCAHGLNSALAIQYALDALRKRIAHQCISIIHNDLPSNDFNSLFRHLISGARWFQYAGEPGKPAPYVYCSAASFYGQIMPESSVHFGFSSFAAHWLSRMPNVCMVEQTFHGNAQGEAKEKIAEQSAADWRTFLTCRAGELAPGGRLVLSLPGRLPADSTNLSGEGEISLGGCMQMVNEVLVEMVERKLIDRSKFEHFVWPFYFRTAEEIKRPFEESAGLRETVKVEQLRTERLSCPLYECFKQGGDALEYADSYVDWLRAWSEATISAYLLGDQSRTENAAALEYFYGRVKEKVLERPHAFVYVFFMIQLVVEKL